MVNAQEEARGLQHNYIGTEHILLGPVREGDGAGAQIIKSHGGDLATVRDAVIELIPAADARAGQSMLRRLGAAGEAGEMDDLPATPAGEASVSGAVRLAGGEPVGSHHLLLAALDDPDSAAARTLVSLGVDLDQAREALRAVDVTGTSDEQPEERGRRHMVLRGHRHQRDHRGHRSGHRHSGQSRCRRPRGPGGSARHHRGDRPECVTLGSV